MYVTVQFIILEILLGLIFLVVLYFMLRELLKKIIRKELREIKEPLQVLANYLAAQAEEEGPEGPDGRPDPDGSGAAGGEARQPGQPVGGPEKLPGAEQLVDIADEFVHLKNNNRVNSYNIRVQKIWDLYKQNKITLVQYKDELLRLKKEFGIEAGAEEGLPEKTPGKAAAGKGAAKLKPLTPTPSAAPKEKVKKMTTKPAGEPGPAPEKGGDTDKDNKAASLDSL